MTKEIVSVSLGSSNRDYEFTTRLFGEDVHVRRWGTNGDLDRARDLVSQFDGQVDAIGLGGMSFQFRVGSRTFIHKQIQQVADAATATPVVDGIHLKNTLERWAITQIAQQDRDIFSHKRIFILSGIHHYAIAKVLGQFTQRITFGDPIFHLNSPFALQSFKQLEYYAKWVLPWLCQGAYRRIYPVGPGEDLPPSRGLKSFQRADIIVGDMAYLRRFAPKNLEHKKVITFSLSADDLDDLRERKVEAVITFTPPLNETFPFVGTNVLEAIFTSFLGHARTETTDDDYLDLASRWELEPQVTILNEPRDVPGFAFVIHPLSTDHIFNHPMLKLLRFVPRRIVERTVANLPPLYLSRMTGIKSPATGKEVEGYLISLGATPREFMRRKPGFTYRRLIAASRMAQQMGAKIMGLGAFTKVVGDAGITVANKADIAITSGNSLTVAATLEAAKQAAIKMGAKDLTRGRAVVIGATGSIGAVCARLLAQAIHDVVLVAPRPEKLIALKKTIESETPGARVVMATDASRHLPEADLVVTTTTAIGEKVIDVLKLKPGCVVCDVARPPDVQENDAQLRPDVLVIESGEVLLPGEPDFGFNIGLPRGVAYACLAETALLAMEGRFENFTLGRNIEMERVKEIYRLFKKHGLALEGLRSFGRYISDEDIGRKRELADEMRRHPEKLNALIAQAQSAQNGHPSPTTATALYQTLKRNGPRIAAGAGAAAIVTGWLRWRRTGSR
jgi:predicted amino acid dehydrogenase